MKLKAAVLTLTVAIAFVTCGSARADAPSLSVDRAKYDGSSVPGQLNIWYTLTADRSLYSNYGFVSYTQTQIFACVNKKGRTVGKGFWVTQRIGDDGALYFLSSYTSGIETSVGVGGPFTIVAPADACVGSLTPRAEGHPLFADVTISFPSPGLSAATNNVSYVGV